MHILTLNKYENLNFRLLREHFNNDSRSNNAISEIAGNATWQIITILQTAKGILIMPNSHIVTSPDCCFVLTPHSRYTSCVYHNFAIIKYFLETFSLRTLHHYEHCSVWLQLGAASMQTEYYNVKNNIPMRCQQRPAAFFKFV